MVSVGSSDYDNSQYSEDMKKFRKMALGTQEYGSEYSDPTSEYGLNQSVSSSEHLQSKDAESSIGRAHVSRTAGHHRTPSGTTQDHLSRKHTDRDFPSKFRDY